MGALLLALSCLMGDPPVADSTSADLIRQLGSGRYLDREAAAKALESQGLASLPALRIARASNDPELKSRAGLLIDKIECSAILRPTMVQLSYKDAPLPLVIKELAAKSAIPVDLEPDRNAAIWDGFRVTIQETAPRPFWNAVDKLGTLAGLRADFNSHPRTGTEGIFFGVRYDLAGNRRNPFTSVSGPFRFQLTGIHQQRDRQFEFDAPEDETNEQFYVQMKIMAEPRLTIGHNGIFKLTEVTDELGQSLIPPDDEREDDDGDGGDQLQINGGHIHDVQVFLRRPDHPGKLIKNLSGSIPIHVMSKKANPLEIPLKASVGKSFLGEELVVTVHAIQHDQTEPHSTIELGLRERSGLGGSNSLFNQLVEVQQNAALSSLQTQIEITDSKGHYLPSFSHELTRVKDEVLLKLSVGSEEGGLPNTLKFFDLVRAKQVVPFTFHDVPMP